MKISPRLTERISLIAKRIAQAIGTILVFTQAAGYAPDIFDNGLTVINSALDYFFPSIPFKYQIINLFAWILLLLFYAATWVFVYYMAKKILKILLRGLVHHILLDLEERAARIYTATFKKLSEEHLKKLEDKTDSILEKIAAVTPISATTGSICTLPGVYKIQEKIFDGFEKTFVENETFPAERHPKTKQEIKITWVYQHPFKKDETS